MSVSTIDVVNDALSTYVGVGIIQSLDEKSPEATVAKQALPAAVREVLTDYHWNRVRAVADLVPFVTAPTPAWAYAFAVPADCLAVWRAEGYDRSPIIYELGINPDLNDSTQFLWSNSPAIRLVYATNRVPISNFPPPLLTLLAMKLASKLVMPLKRDVKLRLSLGDEYLRALARLSAMDANSEPEQHEIDFVPEFIRARL